MNALPTLRSLAKEYGHLAGQVAVLEKNNSVGRTIKKSLVGGSNSLVRVLNVTVKSHKPDGLVTFRNIHGGFLGLGLLYLSMGFFMFPVSIIVPASISVRHRF